MNTEFMGGHPVHPELKGNIRSLMQSSNRPDIVASVERHIISILAERGNVVEELVRTDRALNDAKETAAYWKEKAEGERKGGLNMFVGLGVGLIGSLTIIGIPKYGLWFHQAAEVLGRLFQ